ncbi:hypothetical protein AYR62_15430 [Secundilactobacillus paracollinoides]|uniref:Uncharacterized protein n=1 Tax=Secundilactobacillus paracollinoides TaxID=240427 RepID=A0A1B2IW03_9LACO|nr:hypothetical protein [Secundilactobacillus paracollinoides]ANZ65331.1 hypothetical protein AYR62_15430 [Secundilactobacillus paracollinoides]ANZ66217.1 hypothetical protein AYR63_03050 [Secundilactobacillus paracollinoides]
MKQERGRKRLEGGAQEDSDGNSWSWEFMSESSCVQPSAFWSAFRHGGLKELSIIDLYWKLKQRDTNGWITTTISKLHGLSEKVQILVVLVVCAVALAPYIVTVLVAYLYCR